MENNFSWDRCYDFKNVFVKKISAKILALFAQTNASFCKNVSITLVFEKNANFVRRKLAKIADNCDHNIDPWSQSYDLVIYNYNTRVV
jgi:hypothetical protein